MASTLHPLLASPAPPPFIYIHHPHHPSTSLQTALSLSTSDQSTSTSTSTSTSPNGLSDIILVDLNAVEYYNQRLLLSGIVHRVAERLGKEDEGSGEISDWDSMFRRLRAVWSTSMTASTGLGRDKGKGKANGTANGTASGTANGTAKGMANGNGRMEQNGRENLGDEQQSKRVVVLISKAERLRGVLGPGWSLITRLGEMVRRIVSCGIN
jgi:origin recognition complex subunit 5